MRMAHIEADQQSGASDGDVARTLRLRDGRTLGCGIWGSPSGIPVLGFHGTGTSRLFHYGDEVPRAAGVRLVLPDRPGFGLSDPHMSGTLLDWAQDVEELANSLQFHRFAVFGVSGGGPPALACGLALPNRVAAVGLVSAVGPCQDEPTLIPYLPERRRQLAELAPRDRAPQRP
jgi:pimeloyl-ACP methyl ester carboxylesterase